MDGADGADAVQRHRGVDAADRFTNGRNEDGRPRAAVDDEIAGGVQRRLRNGDVDGGLPVAFRPCGSDVFDDADDHRPFLFAETDIHPASEGVARLHSKAGREPLANHGNELSTCAILVAETATCRHVDPDCRKVSGCDRHAKRVWAGNVSESRLSLDRHRDGRSHVGEAARQVARGPDQPDAGDRNQFAHDPVVEQPNLV